MPVIEIAGRARLHYEIEGDGPLLLLLHGGTGTGAYDWEHLRVPLARGHRVVVPDMRGHGRSSEDRAPSSAAPQASRVLRVGLPERE